MIINADALEGLKTIESNTVDCIITSPPYYQLRDYGVNGQIGLEDTVDEYIHKLCLVFRECYRVLKPDGTLWIVIGDTYNGDKKGITDRNSQYLGKQAINKSRGRFKRKTLLMVPSRLAIAMIDDGWILRNEIIWHKPNVMPQSVKDRFTIDFEKILFFTKSEKYYFKQQKEPMKTLDFASPRGSKAALYQLNKGLRIAKEYNRTVSAKKQDNHGNQTYVGFNDRYEAPKDAMRNKRSVWNIPTSSSGLKHYAMFPLSLVEQMIDAGCRTDGVVLDPFCGSGTTLRVAKYKGHPYIGIDINPEYVKMAEERLSNTPIQGSLFNEEI